MCPEDVAPVVRNVASEFFMFELAELSPGEVEPHDVNTVQREFFDCPLDPMFDMSLVPVHWICSQSNQS